MQNIKRKQFLKMALLANAAMFAQPLKMLSSNKLQQPVNTKNVTYFKKGDAQYEILRQGFNKRINKFPLIIAQCNNTDGVSEAIIYAGKNNLPVAIKSGGHCMEGFSCNNDGMVINLSLINDIEWINNNTIKVGPACTLSKIYETILPKNKIIPGGSCAGVGIGGLTLGGGYGLMARKFGLTCDSLIDATMVDGNGNIKTASNETDLLWACKGGGNGNFGVVTNLTFKVHKAPTTLQSFRFKSYKVNSAKAKTILQKWFDAVANLPPACFSAYVLNNRTCYILLTNADKHTYAVHKVVTTLSEISDKTSFTEPTPLAKALKVFYGIQHPLFFKNASAGLYKSFAEIDGCIDDVLDIVTTTPGMIYQVNTLGGNIINNEFEMASAFAHRDCTYFSELQTYWEAPKHEKNLLQKFEAVQQLFSKNGINTQYKNYPDVNFKNTDEMYYGNNVAELKAVKNKYDPLNIFRGEQTIK
jgi:FAD binding domain/Berberine and berberine like